MFERRYIFQTIIFGIYVSFQGCKKNSTKGTVYGGITNQSFKASFQFFQTGLLTMAGEQVPPEDLECKMGSQDLVAYQGGLMEKCEHVSTQKKKACGTENV